MPNGYNLSKEYGPHDYGNREGTCDCKHGCGCWMGSARSGGPLGLDPFGECPGNPKDTKKLPGKDDYEIVVTRRIKGLEHDLYQTRQELEALKKIRKTPKAQMARRIEKLETALAKRKEILKEISKRLKLAKI